ncbi:MAG: zf-HC2 domain-containing protein [bacterium]
MTDCPNADVRDLLPDLLHERLDEAMRAKVEAHVDGCEDCAAELALLRELSGVLRRAPELDIAAIAGAIPMYRAPVRRSWVGWRTAAAITLMVAGGSSMLVLRRNVSPVPDSLALPPSAVSDSPSALVPAPVPAPAGVSAPVTIATKPVAIDTPATSVAPVSSVPTAAASASATPVRAGRELALSSGPLNDLSDRELAMLLKEIESLDAVTSVDVDNSVISPIAPRRSRP